MVARQIPYRLCPVDCPAGTFVVDDSVAELEYLFLSYLD
jgi:hypothetical protein